MPSEWASHSPGIYTVEPGNVERLYTWMVGAETLNLNKFTATSYLFRQPSA